ncbi:nitrite/sulfite reductase [Paraliomyxa miuraensis]|uniref:nitrite/sulfite reductase n=1 Tax=Paraliomyxa miuraensis TaxID=376150 RepID=UPI00225935B6|nr:nitrite/sulfite reductase [Paraliomyxa miuraensis]MCX4243882.1 nitrite/sulfite reductase [Paraliomyxa miuraensis]
MYQYDIEDQRLVEERAAQFRGQVQRRLEGSITEDEFKPLRLQNGLYMQLHAYMLRVAIPYGLLSSTQLRKLAHIARVYDKGYGHFSTRQNIQYNWPKLADVPTILDELASVQMHAIQTSGNCIRNTTSDHLAGVAPDELEDPRPYCEVIRQWSTFHPEFAFLPRKFKIAVTGTPDDDRAAVRFHDIGIRLVQDPAGGEHCFEILVGGGMGRTPHIAKVIREFLPYEDLLSYLEAILRVYNRYGRRDNKFKARIKILVSELGIDEFKRQVDDEWAQIRDGGLKLLRSEIDRIKANFAPPPYRELPPHDLRLSAEGLSADPSLRHFVRNNVKAHRQPGYCAVVISLKAPGRPPGDASDTQMDVVAELADEFGFGRIVVTHTQNLVLPDVEQQRVAELHARLREHELHTANIGTLTDSICCPGLDFCNLANARSIPVAIELGERFDRLDYLADLGEVSLKISGCINACGHHHVGNIGILGIDKIGEEAYQLVLGGSPGNDASIGKIVGRAFNRAQIVDAVQTVLEVYLRDREDANERFIDYYRRVGEEPFKEALYGDHQEG